MSRKTFITTIIITAFLISLVAGMQSVEVAKANPTWGLRPSTPSQDKPIIVIESPENNTYCGNGSAMLNFTVIKPSSWNWTFAPFGSCANGNIESVNVNLNGIQEFQDYLSADNLNGGGYWNKSYSLTIDGLNSGLNSLSLIVLANALYINSSVTVGDITTRTSGSVPMNVTDTLYLISGISSNSSANSILSSSSTERFPSLTPSPSPTPIPSPSPTQQPTLPPLQDYTPTPSPIFAPPSSTIQPSPSPTPTPTSAAESVLVLIIVLAVVVVVTGVLIYLRRIKKQK